jgi:hypothetical protein
MKRTLALLLLVSLLATPALAYAQGSNKGRAVVDVDATRVDAESLKAETLKEAIVTVSRELVAEESSALEAGAVVQRAGSGWRTVIGIAMIAGGAGIIAKGFEVYQDEPDRFERTKNADSYLAWGVGAGILGFGILTLKGGLDGRGF